MNTRQIIVIFCLFAVLFSALSIASASENVDNITVSVANDENAINVANDNDEILQDPQGNFTELNSEIQSDTSGSISLDKDYVSNGDDTIVISKDITIDGHGKTLNADGKSSIFNIMGNSHVILKDIVFTNAIGEDGSAIMVNYGSAVEIIDCKFINNNATDCGGAVYIIADDSSMVSKITNSIFENNKALNGGAVYLHSDKATIEGSTFLANSADNDGAAVYVAGDYCNLANSTFTDNIAGDDGPAVYWQGNDGMLFNISCSGNRGISGIDPRDGSRSSSKGGTICLTGSNVTISKSNFTDSSCGYEGGAIFLTGNNGNVIDCVFDNCTSIDTKGGALYIIGNNSNIKGCNYTQCSANLSGGVIYVDGNVVTIDNNRFIENGANLDGAALYVAGDDCNLYNSVFTGNIAGDDGGAIYWEGNGGFLYNITCTNNKGISGIDPIDGTVSNSKGGTICLTGSDVTIDKSTFTKSSAVVDGGALFITGNNNNVLNSVFEECTSIDTNGGALYIIGNNTNIQGCNYTQCSANISAGVIYVQGHDVTIDNNRFIENGANLDGAALYVAGDDCNLLNSVFTGNVAGDDGGAIYWEGDRGNVYNITCTNNKGISDNKGRDPDPSNSKGGTICLTGSDVTINKSTFKQSSAVSDGGALFITGNNNNVLNSVFEDCTSVDSGGGAIYIIGNNTSVSNSTFDDCNVNDLDAVKHHGGAIFVDGDDAHISDSSFTGTHALIGGAIYIAGDDTVIDNSEFSHNDASGSLGGSGGAIYVDGSGAVVSNSKFSHATTINYGGAISVWGQNAVITNSTFEDSVATSFRGGAIYVNGLNTTISYSNFTRDKTVNDYTRGGAIDVDGNDTYILGCNIEDCTSFYGGAIQVSGSNSIIENTTFKGTSAYDGGAIYVDGANSQIIDSNFTSISATRYGGAIYVAGTYTNISGNNFLDCTAKTYHGGAIYVAGDHTTIEKSNFTLCKGLSTVARGGGVCIEYGDHALIKDSFFDRCSAVDGGDVYVFGNFARIEDSTFNASSASQGGAIYLSAWGSVIKGSNISGCDAKYSGGAIYVAGGGSNILNTSIDGCIAKGSLSSHGGGAIYIKGPDTIISDSKFNNNKVNIGGRIFSRGGTIFIEGEGTTILNSEFNNSIAYQGGIIYIEGEKAIIDSSIFANSSSTEKGGAISVNGNDATIQLSTFDNIYANNNGGAIYVQGKETDILNSTFTKCVTKGRYSGGAIYINDIMTTVAFSNFTLCTSEVAGAIYINGKNTSILYCNLDNNNASSAGAIKVFGNDTIISNTNFTNNNAITGSGGALDIGGSNASVYSCWFDNNDAKLNGGAINWIGGHGDDTILGSTFTNNHCHGTKEGGGAIFWTAGDINNIPPGGLILECKFINNTAYGHHGGAIDWYHARDSTINNCLFLNNTANSDGGALYTGDQGGKGNNLMMSNCQFYNNYAGKHGGAIANQMSNSWIYNNTFDGNHANASGGTILMKEGHADNSVVDHCYIYNSYIDQNYPGNKLYGVGGGAIRIGDKSITISNCAIINSTANKTHGGAISIDGGASGCSLINVSIQSSTILDGYGGAISWSGSYGTLNNVTIFNSSSNLVNDDRAYPSDDGKSAKGGAIYLGGSYCNLNDIKIFNSSSNNNNLTSKSTSHGGAIYVKDGSSHNTLTNIEIDDSSALSVKMNTNGGAIYWGTSGYGTLVNVTISNTLANGQGGAIYWKGGNTPTISNISISYSRTNVTNSANSADGGAIFSEGINDLNNVYIIDAIASKDSGDIRGGAIYYNGNRINNVTVIGSRASTDAGTTRGGALYWNPSGNSGTMYNSSFENNTADLGGALFNGKTVTLYDTSFIGNVAKDGGAIYASKDAILHNVSLILNSAKRGGAIFSTGSNINLKIYDSYLSNNTGEEKGGAIYRESTGTSTEIKDSDLVNNTAFQGSAMYTNKFFSLVNVVLLDNQANSNKFVDKTVGVDEEGRNYTSAVFIGFDNVLNAIWVTEATISGSCNNVTYWGVNGRNVSNGKPNKSDREVWQNVTVEMYNEDGEFLNSSDLVTDASGKVTYVFDAKDGETYYFAYIHESDRYYTYLRDTLSNSSVVKVYIDDYYHGNMSNISISLTDGAWGSLNGTVTLFFNDTNHKNLTIEVINGTYHNETIDLGLPVDHYNVTAVFKGDLEHLGDTDWDLFTVLPVDDLHIEKVVNITADYVNVTDKIKYTINVTNHGPSRGMGVNVTEILSPYLKLLSSEASKGNYNVTSGNWYIGDLDVDEVVNLTIIAQVIHEGPITNTVWVIGAGNDTNLTNDISSAHNFTAVNIVDLRIIKDVNYTGDIINVTDVLQFNITVFNDGPCNATGVYVDEALDFRLEILSNQTTLGEYKDGTWNIGTLYNGTNATLIIVAKVIYSGNISNVVTVVGTENETNYTNNRDAIKNITAIANVDLKIKKEVNVTKYVNVTDKIEFTIRICNDGPCNATGVYVSELLDSHLRMISNEATIGEYDGATWIIGSLNKGIVHNLTIIAEVISSGTIPNYVNITSEDNDTNLTNNEDWIDNLTALDIVDLMINKTVNTDKTTVRVTDQIAFTIYVKNNGPCDATNVTVTEKLSPHLKLISNTTWVGNYSVDKGIWYIGNLSNQSWVELSLVCEVISAGNISNVVVVTSNENDTDYSNNRDNITNITALPIVDLGIKKTVNITTGIINVSDKIKFTITVHNYGPCNATLVNVTEVLSPHLKLLTNETQYGYYNLTEGIWHIGNLNNQSTAVLTLECEVIHDGFVENDVIVRSFENDTDLENNWDVVVITPVPITDLIITKKANVSGKVNITDKIQFDINVYNRGPSNATGVYVIEELDSHLRILSNTTTIGEYVGNTWIIGNLTTKTLHTLTIVAEVISAGNFSNDVVVIGIENETNKSNNHDSIDNITAFPIVDLQITKEVYPLADYVNVTDRIYFTITIVNKGPCDATNVSVVEKLDSHLKLISNSTSIGNYDVDKGIWYIGNMTNQSGASLSLVCEVTSAGIISNVVIAKSNENDTNYSNNKDSINNITALPIVDLEIHKKSNASSGLVNVSDKIEFTITVSNNGPCDATLVNVTEALSPCLKLLDNQTRFGYYNVTDGVWYIGNLANQSTAVLTLLCEVVKSGYFENVVVARSYENDTNPYNNRDVIAVIASDVVDLVIDKKVNYTSDKIEVTDKIEFTLTVTNRGPSNATGVYVAEFLSPCLKLLSYDASVGDYDGSTTWIIGNLTKGEVATLKIRAQVAYSGMIENNVTVYGTEKDSNYTNNNDNITPINASAHVDLAIVKNVDVSGKVNVSDLIKFTITVTNNGPCNATGVYVAEVLDSHLRIVSNTTTIGKYDGFSWQIGNLDKGAVHNLTIIAEVISAGNITNEVTISGYDNDSDLSNNHDSIDNITALPIVDLRITKDVYPQDPYVNVTDTIYFVVTVYNRGPCDATNVSVVEKLDSHLKLIEYSTRLGDYNVTDGVWYIGNLTKQSSVFLYLVCEVTSVGNISNVVSVTSYENDTNPSNNKDSIDNITALPIVDLEIHKKSNVSSNRVNVSDKIEFTITVSNNGPCDATLVNVTEVLSPCLKLLDNQTRFGYYNVTDGVWHVGDLANQSTAVLTLVCEVVKSGYFENVVVARSYENDTNPDNNKDVIGVIAYDIIDLVIEKTVTPDSDKIEVTDNIEFTITVTNRGPSNATGVYVAEFLSPLLKLISYDASVGSYDGSTTWIIGNLTKGVVATLKIKAQVVYSGMIENNVTVYGTEKDTDYTNNNDNITPINASAHVDLGILKEVNVKGKVNVTDLIKFTISVYNNGPCNATGVFVSEILNSNLRLVSYNATVGDYDGFTWQIGYLDMGAVHNLTIVAEVISAGNITNVVTIDGYDNDSDPSNNKASIDNITALPIVDLSITKSVNVTSGVTYVNDEIKFTITVTNKGPCNATGVYVGEILDSHLEYVSNETTVGSYDGFTWTIGNLANQSSAVLTIVARVASVGNISNVVVVKGIENDTDPSNNKANITNITALPVADLRVNKTVNVTVVNVTGYIKYTITVVNAGPCDATGVNVTENLSPLVRPVKAETNVGYYDISTNIWHIGDLSVNNPVVLDLTVQVMGNGTIENTVIVKGNEKDNNESNNNGSSENVTAYPIVDLAIVKTANLSGNVEVTDLVNFTITVTNNGPCYATGIYVAESLSPLLELVSYEASVGDYDGYTWKNIDKLDVGENITLTIVARIVYSGIIENNVTVYGIENDTNLTNNDDGITPLNATAHVDLGIIKKVNVSGKVNVTDLIEFTVTVYNNGPCNATGVYVGEILNSNLRLVSNETTIGYYDGFTWHIGYLDKGAVHNLTIIAEVISVGNITNAVTIKGYDNDSDPSNNNASIDNITALPIVDLQITKEVNVTSGLVNITDLIEFTITVKNNGPCDATGVFVGEVLDSHLEHVSNETTVGSYDGFTWTIGNLANQSSAVLTIVARVVSLGNISNEVVVNGIENDTDPSNNKANITNITALPIVDLSVNKTVNATVVNVTDLIEYEITVVNAGPCNATGVNVTEKLSPFVKLVKAETEVGYYDNSTNIWHIGDLSVDKPVVLTLTVQVIANGTIENSVIVTSRENDTNKSNNNGSSDNVTALPIVDIKISKVVNATLVNVTDLIEYTITVVNNGPSNATGVEVCDRLDSHLEFVSFDSSRTGITYDSKSGIAVVGNLDANETVVLTIIAKVVEMGVIPNTVNVTSNENDTDKSNNNASSDNVTALPIVDLKINKTVSTTVAKIDDEFTYIITVVNNGPSTATNVNVFEKLSDYVTLVEDTASKGSYDVDKYNWYIGELANGENATLTLVVKVISNGTIENVVSVNSTENDTNITNNKYPADNVTVYKFYTPIDLDTYDITYGDDEILTVTLPREASGTLNITVGDRTYANLPIENGKVVLPVSDLAGGDYTVNVYYGGDGVYMPNSTSGTFNVARVTPIITIEVEDIWVGEIEVLNVTVNAPGTVNVTVYGITVTISLDNGVVTTDVLAAAKNSYSGNATWNLVNLPVGAYPAFAIYPGNENYTSVNTSDLFHVRDIPTTTIVSADDIYVGEEAVISIEVGPEGVTGNVEVTVDGETYIVPLNDGKATLIVPDLSAGTYEVYARYNGTILYRPSENTTTFNVLKLKPPISIDAPEITVGEDGVIIVTVPDDATGTITIEIGGKRYTSEIEDGEAIFFIPGLKEGVHDIVAYYSGDDKYLPTNTTGSIKVNPLHENKTHNVTPNKKYPPAGGINLAQYPTGNPIFVLLVIILTIGSIRLRRFKR